MANSIALFKSYVAMLDEVYKLASLSSVLDGAAELAQQGANVNELIIPKISMDGLANYSRNGGYVAGDVTLTNETVKCNFDRGRMFSIDNLDNAETAGVAYGRLASEFIRTKVVPELDAFRFAQYAQATGIGTEMCIRDSTGPERAGFDRLRYGLDFGFAVDPDALLAMHYSRPTRTLYILDEYYRAGGSVDKLAEAAKKLAGSGRLTADSEDPRMIAELRRRGLSVEGAKKGPGSVEHGMRWLQDLGRIVIDPKACPNAAREFAAYEYERDRWGNFRARYPDRDNHAIDAARYGCEDIMTHKLARVRSKSGAGLY